MAALEPVPDGAAPPTVPLMNRNFSLLWAGQTVSQLGNEAFSISMMWWLTDQESSATLMSLLVVASVLPGVLLSPFGGALADRCSRIRIVIWSDYLAGLGISITALSFWLWPADQQLLIKTLFFAHLLLGVTRGFFEPALSASITHVVPSEGQRAAANSLMRCSAYAARSFGQVLGGVLFGLLGARGLFLTDAVSFFFAGGSGSFIPRDKPKGEDNPDVSIARQFLRDIACGLRWIRNQRGLWGFVLGASLINFLLAPATLVFPFFVKAIGLDQKWYGLFMASLSLGMVAGFLIVSTLHLSGMASAQGVLAGLILQPICFLVLAFVHTPAPIVMTLLVVGVATGFTNIFMVTLLQDVTPEDLLGRVMGIVATLSGGLMPLGKAVGGVLADLTHKNAPVVFLWGSGPALVIAIFVVSSRQCWKFLAAHPLRASSPT